MLKVLIVDDEPGAIKALKYALDWESFGFVVAGEAMNGSMAIERLKENHYDLLLTDIRMPGISGLELIAAIREHSELPIIVVSGYEEFEYVKECLKHGVKDYLLKPVDEDEVIKLLKNVQQDIKSAAELHQKLHLGVPAMRDQLLKKWAHGGMTSSQALAQLRLLNTDLKEQGWYSCLMIEMDFQETMDVHRTERDIEVLSFAVRNVIEEVVGSTGYVFEESRERYGVILMDDEASSLEEAYEQGIHRAESIKQCVRQYVKLPITIGVGEAAESASLLKHSFDSAAVMLDRKFLLGQDSIITCKKGGNERKSPSTNSIETTKHLIEAMQLGERERVAELLSQQLEQFVHQEAPKSVIQSVLFDLLATLIRMEREWVNAKQDDASLAADELQRILQASSVQELIQYTKERCLQVMAQLEETRKDQRSHAIDQVKRIVAKEYASNLSLKSISETIYMNPVYLGHLFKASEGKSFNDYLLQVRMEHAKAQLTCTNKKIYTIANEVGYRQMDWFYKKFKEYTGLSAGEFRAQHAQGEEERS